MKLLLVTKRRDVLNDILLRECNVLRQSTPVLANPTYLATYYVDRKKSGSHARQAWWLGVCLEKFKHTGAVVRSFRFCPGQGEFVYNFHAGNRIGSKHNIKTNGNKNKRYNRIGFNDTCSDTLAYQ